MTINEAIQRVDELKPNALAPETKARWISNLNGIIGLTLFKNEAATILEYPNDADKELLVPSPFDDLYVYHVMAMIDLQNEDVTEYNNSNAVYQTALQEYTSFYQRTTTPPNQLGYRNVW